MGYDKHLDFASHCCKIYKCFLRYVKYLILLKFDQNNTLKCFFFLRLHFFALLWQLPWGPLLTHQELINPDRQHLVVISEIFFFEK